MSETSPNEVESTSTKKTKTTVIERSSLEVKSLSDAEVEDRRAKRYRRKRGNGRYRPYRHSPSDDGSGEEEKNHKRGSMERLNMAPSNTTQFLLEDREKRAEFEHENEKQYEECERIRIRSFSCSSDQKIGSRLRNASSEHGSKDGDSDHDRELDREFESEYLEVKRERIEKMSKSELERELLERDRDTETLHDQCAKINSENRLLKELLTANGIPYEQEHEVSSTSVTVNHHESRSPRVTAN